MFVLIESPSRSSYPRSRSDISPPPPPVCDDTFPAPFPAPTPVLMSYPSALRSERRLAFTCCREVKSIQACIPFASITAPHPQGYDGQCEGEQLVGDRERAMEKCFYLSSWMRQRGASRSGRGLSGSAGGRLPRSDAALRTSLFIVRGGKDNVKTPRVVPGVWLCFSVDRPGSGSPRRGSTSAGLLFVGGVADNAVCQNGRKWSRHRLRCGRVEHVTG